VIGSRIINETHFQYRHDAGVENPYSTLPEIDVLGAFNGGGNSLGTNTDYENLYELQNYTSIAYARHFLKFGIRLRAMTDSNNSTGSQATGFNGAFTFSSLNAYEATTTYLAANPLATTLPAGLGPSQFSLITGTPFAKVTMYDLGPYIQDDWRVRPNLTVSYGLRFETQDRIRDHTDFAPRLGVAWGVGGTKPKLVLRVGWGIFYDRFPPNLVLQAERQNDVTEQESVISHPNFFCPNGVTVVSCPAIATLQGTSAPTIYQIAPNLRSPMLMQTGVSVERQFTKAVSASISYLNSRGWRQLVTSNVNAPELNGIPISPANGGVYPLTGNVPENIYQYESAGVFRQNQLVLNTTIRAGAKLTLNAYYSLNYASSDTAGANSFSSDPYNLMADYGRAAFDIRSRVFFGGTIGLRYGLRLSPFLVASSGVPYNVTLGQDLAGTSLFNQRPSFVSSSACAITQVLPGSSIFCTPFGTFNSQPTPGEAIVPINDLTGPSQFSLNLRITKTFSFGRLPEGSTGQVGARQNGGGGQRGGGGAAGIRPPAGGGGGFGGAGTVGRYSVVLSVNARNIFNNVNFATPIGTLTSPLFGVSNGISNGVGGFGGGAQTSGAGAPAGLPAAGGGAPAANRQIYLQATFGF
jgi:hypothetical protein